MNFLDQVCDAQPLYFLGGSILVLALLLLALVLVIAWPMNSRIRIDPHGEAYGDQPQVPS